MIRGYCVGGGLSLALACDFRYAAPDVKMGVPIARTLGNCLSMSNYARVVDLVGPARTKDLVMLARLLDAREALALGLVNAVVPVGQLTRRVKTVAQTLTTLAPLTLRATKEAVRRIQAHRRLAPGEGEDLIVSCYMSEDFRSAVAAFPHKRGKIPAESFQTRDIGRAPQMCDPVERIPSARAVSSPGRERGAALIVVLLFTVLMLILITTMLSVTGNEVLIARVHRDSI